MRSGWKWVLVVITAATVAACRQSDGPPPEATKSVPEELYDIRRDLQNVAGKVPAGPTEFADDLRKFVQLRPSAEPAVTELARRTTAVIAGKKMTDQAGDRLAHSLWTGIAGRQFSDRQVESLQNDVHSQLVGLGVPEENAQQVAAQIAEVQKAVTDRPRRWYEWF